MPEEKKPKAKKAEPELAESYYLFGVQVDSFLRLQSASVRFDLEKGFNVVSGKNRQGKTSLQEAIWTCLGGKKVAKEDLVHDGADSAELCIDLVPVNDPHFESPGRIRVIRTIDRDGKWTLKVHADGRTNPFRSPQALLDSFFNHLAFDPSEFLRMSAAKQGEVMVSVAGVEEDVKAKREEHARLYEERTNVNHDKAKAEASLADMKEPAPGGPREETPSTDILNQIDDANEHNKANAEKRKELQDLYATHAEVKKSLSEQDALIEDLENQLEKARAKRQEIAMELDAVVERGQDMRPEVAALVDKDTESLRAKLATLDADNKLARDAAAYRAKKDEVAAHDTASKKLTARMDEIKAEIGLIMAGSKLPIEGLSVDTSGSVLFNGKPFNQASSAETLEVSLAMGAAMNPRLRFLTLREASMMDDETRDSVVEWARKNGYFVLLELATSKDFGIHIENGLVTSVSESSEVKGE